MNTTSSFSEDWGLPKPLSWFLISILKMQCSHCRTRWRPEGGAPITVPSPQSCPVCWALQQAVGGRQDCCSQHLENQQQGRYICMDLHLSRTFLFFTKYKLNILCCACLFLHLKAKGTHKNYAHYRYAIITLQNVYTPSGSLKFQTLGSSWLH